MPSSSQWLCARTCTYAQRTRHVALKAIAQHSSSARSRARKRRLLTLGGLVVLSSIVRPRAVSWPMSSGANCGARAPPGCFDRGGVDDGHAEDANLGRGVIGNDLLLVAG